MKKYFIITFYILLTFNLKSQIVFYGNITDEKDTPIPYANIILKNNRAGTSSNELGSYKIILNNIKYKHDTLIVSFVGYETKNIPVILFEQQRINIILEKAPFLINSVTISGEKPKYTALQIIKKARQNIRKNYVNETVVQEGFYRELLKENGISIKLNECSFDYKSLPYPQARYSKKSFHDYWDDYWDNKSKRIMYATFSSFVQHWPLFITPNDKVNIIKSRVSADRPSIDGVFKQTGNPLGGPIDVIALNNIKYKFDFMNPKLTNKYIYEIVGIKYVDNYYCYVINYAPKDTSRFRYSHNASKKVSIPLFKGQIVIKKDDFTIISFTSESIDWYNSINHRERNNFFLTYNPNKIKFSVKYQKTEKGWILQNINYTSNYNSTYKNSSNYIWQRELNLSLPKDTLFFHDNSTDYFPIRHESLRDRTNSYDANFWHNFEKHNLFIPLTQQEKNDLEDILPLETQFNLLNQPVSKIPKPNFVNIIPKMFISKLTEIKDTSLFNKYIEEENTYADIVLQKINYYKREFNSFSILFRKYNVNTIPKKQKNKYFTGLDSLNNFCYYQRINDTTNKNILNLSYESEINKNGNIKDIVFGNKYISLLINFKSKIGNVLKIKEKSKINTIDSIYGVNEFFDINDSTILYSKFDKGNRVSKLFIHKKGSEDDSLLIYINNPEYDIELYKTTSDKYIIIDVTSKNQNEIWAFNKLNLSLKRIHNRSKRKQVKVDHFYEDKYFVSLISSNNYVIIKTNINTLQTDTLVESKKLIDDFYQYNNNLLYTEYNKFDMRLVLLDCKNHNTKYIEPQKGINYIELIKNNSKKDSTSFMVESVVNPFQEYKINIRTGKYRLIDDTKYAYSPQKSNYKSEIINVKNNKGIDIPVLIFYDEKAIKDSVTAILIEAYGAYGGISISSFDERNIELLRKGFIIARPAVRGGGTLGQDWYFAGKLLNKKNTFNDFITVTRALKKKYNLPTKKVFAKGVSAGGLIMGVMANEYSDEFGGIILDRPFLDVYNSMKDSTKYLTTIEYQEWGNPKDSIFDKYIKSYSPCQNIKKQNYTNLFFRASENDIVTPLKQILNSVLKYRENNKSNNLILLKIDKNEGHFVRYSNNRIAEEYSFMMYIINNN